METKEIYKLYKGEILLTFDPVKHIYEVGGKVVEGVTGVTGVINKPALMYWAVNMTIEHLKRVLRAGRMYDEIQIIKMLEDAKYAHRIKKTTAGDIGTLVHEAIETYIKTGEQKNPVNKDARRAFKKFLNWAKTNSVRFIESERKIYSKKLGYAGTMDFYAQIGDKNFVGDSKTSSGIWDEYWFQTSAYEQAYKEETGNRVDGQIIVRVGKDGSIEVKENYEYAKNVKAFNGALELFRRMQELKSEGMKTKKEI